MHPGYYCCTYISYIELNIYFSFSVSGAIQSFAGFTDYFSAMAQEGWFPLLCVGLRSQWEDVHLQDLQDSYGQEWVSIDLDMLTLDPFSNHRH